jgi:hypothetical protein
LLPEPTLVSSMSVRSKNSMSVGPGISEVTVPPVFMSSLRNASGNDICFVERCLNNALRLETYIEDAERAVQTSGRSGEPVAVARSGLGFEQVGLASGVGIEVVVAEECDHRASARGKAPLTPDERRHSCSSLRVRGLDRVRLNADLMILAKLACALSGERLAARAVSCLQTL